MSVDPLHARLRSFARVAVRAFVFTWLAMSVGGIVLAVLAGKWMPAVDPVVRTLLQVFFAGQFIVVGFYLAFRRSVAAALTSGVKSLQLGRAGLSVFFDRFDRTGALSGDNPDVIDEPRDAATPSTTPGAAGEISLAMAQARIGQIVSALAFGRRSGRGMFGWLRSTLVSMVGAIVLARFRKKADRATNLPLPRVEEPPGRREGRGEGDQRIDIAGIRHELESEIDDLLLARLRYTLIAWTLLVVAFLVAEVVVVSLIANRLAS